MIHTGTALPAIWPEIIITNSGQSLSELTESQPVLLVFLRYFGCSFCREAISDIAKKRVKLEKAGIRVVFVHMAADNETAEAFFKKYKLFPIDYIADPEKVYYAAFGLGKTTPRQLAGLMNWIRGFQAGVMAGHGFDPANEALGDGFQMPGVFLIDKNKVVHAFIHRHPYDRPDYESICGI